MSTSKFKTIINIFSIFRDFVPSIGFSRSNNITTLILLLCENMRNKRSELWMNKLWVIHHDKVLILQSNSPYLPDLTPCEFCFLPRSDLHKNEYDFRPLNLWKKNQHASWRSSKKKISNTILNNSKFTFKRQISRQIIPKLLIHPVVIKYFFSQNNVLAIDTRSINKEFVLM